jgi:hypothetical protein
MRIEDVLFPAHVYPEYWFYWDRAQFSGSDVHEFHIGELYRSKMTWRNPGSEYVRDEALVPFLPPIHAAMPAFDFHGENRFVRAQVVQLLTALEETERCIRRAASVAELAALNVSVDSHDFGRKKYLMQTMVQDFSRLCKSALQHRAPLWILGP